MFKNSLLIIGTGGIYFDKEHRAFCPPDDGSFATQLSKAGLKVTYCSYYVKTPRDETVHKFEITGSAFGYKLIRGNRPYCYIDQIKLLFLIASINYVYIYYPGGMSVLASLLCRILRKNHGIYVRGNGLYNADTDYSAITKNTLNNIAILKHANYLVTVAPNIRQSLLEYNSNSHLIRQMFDWDRNYIFKGNISRLRPEKWILLFVGSMIDLKGIDELVEIANIMNGRGVSFSLRLIGDGPKYRELKHKQSRNEIVDNIELLGAMKDRKKLEKEYESANAFIFPSRTEGFPRVLYEAMLKNLPIFTTMVGGIPGIMKDKFNCIEIPVQKPHEQAEIIIKSLDNTDLLMTITKNGLDTVLDALENREPHHSVLLNCIFPPKQDNV